MEWRAGTGRGRGNRGRENRASGPRDAPRQCFYFSQLGGCKFGLCCRFSHDLDPSVPPARQQQTSGLGRGDSSQARMQREWRSLLPRHLTGYTRPLADRLPDFFRLALELVNSHDAGTIQQVIQALATEEGLQRVNELTDPQGVLTSEDRKETWALYLHPYLALLTYPLVINSSILENEVGVLFNHLVGFNGTRMARVFDFTKALLKETENEDGFGEKVLELSCHVLLKMVTFSVATSVNETVQATCRYFLHYCNTCETLTDDFFMKQAKVHLGAISRRLNIADGIQVPQDDHGRSTVLESRPIFVLQKDLPGILSSRGPRHSNDHDDITKIKILPPIEEILSTRTEYRPRLDPSEWHLQGARGLLDRHFRLIREDTVGQLRDSVRAELEVLTGRQTRGATDRNGTGIRVHSYPDATVTRMGFDKRSGFKFIVHCRHPQLPVGYRTRSQRKQWWEQSKRMQSGALVCLVDPNEVLFCRVQELPSKQFDGLQDKSLEEDVALLEVHLQLAEPSQEQAEQEIRHLAGSTPLGQRSLVEFPGILLDSFKLVLEALQTQFKTMDLAFAPIIAPIPGSAPPSTTEPPLYSLQPGFAFDLTPICSRGLSMKYSPLEPPDIEGLCASSTLDESQAKALFNSLRHGLALTQGPPGTGKSYTGECLVKVLQTSRQEADLGPIVCVCYTNHALDQLLEHLWDSGIQQIVRIGSQSKSKVLDQVNLRVIARDAEKSQHESKTRGKAASVLGDIEYEIPRLLERLHTSGTPANMLQYRLSYPNHQWTQYFHEGIDEDGFRIINGKRSGSLMKTWLKGGDRGGEVRPIEILQNLNSPQDLSNLERHVMYDEWAQSSTNTTVEIIADAFLTFQTNIAVVDKVQQEVDLRCLRQAHIVGVTTTGLARNLQMLRNLNSKVLLCEEAGEVLEGHLLTALLPSIEHAIFIGDHQQLRPQIQNYELQSTNPQGEKYSLDMSLFERLVQPLHETDPVVPYNTLEIQRRMHPSISRLIRATLYPSLVDGPGVGNYPGVSGMKNRLFWFDHRHPESAAQGGASMDTSQSNDFEVTMTAALVSHLVRQGTYEKGEIAVITPYLGQLRKLRQQLSKIYEIILGERDVEELEHDGHGYEGDELNELKAVNKTTLSRQLRIATVDNFQGEEAKVIVISLVRSNKENKCGFLRTSNRINVLLSRAQHGMYIIGNSETYGHVDMWGKVINMMKENDEFGSQFELQCPRHLEMPITASEPDHFVVSSPEGGCNLPCQQRLECGHRCTSRCHADVMHMAVRCLEPCPKPLPGCDHACPRVCGDPCESQCPVVLSGEELTLPCEHVLDDPKCWETQHPSRVQCKIKTKLIVPRCFHKITSPCYVDVSAIEYRCEAKCGVSLRCGHDCARPCWGCHVKYEDGHLTIPDTIHKSCIIRCGRRYTTCKHSCAEPCHQGTPCDPCSQPCDVRCSHSRCPLECNEPCTPCAESDCSSSCPHSQCTMPCAAPCDWLPCDERCTKELACGHQCPSICGEPCPAVSLCQICCDDSVRSIVADMLEFKQYGEIDLEEDPCIFPDCGHIKTLSTLDGVMDISSHYNISPEGHIASIKGCTEPFSGKNSEAKVCPECRGSLRNISRYGRIVRRALLWESHQKFTGWLITENNRLSALLSSWEVEYLGRNTKNHHPLDFDLFNSSDSLRISGTGQQIVFRLLQFVGGGRYSRINNTCQQMNTYLRKVRKEEQPYQRVYNLVQHARRQKKTTNLFTFDASVFQAKGELLAIRLQLKCLVSILTDFATIRDNVAKVTTAIVINLDQLLGWCKTFITLSKERKYPRYQLEGYILFIRLSTLALQFLGPKAQALHDGHLLVPIHAVRTTTTAVPEPKSKQEYLDVAQVQIDLARQLLDSNPSCGVLQPEFDAATRGLIGGTFYQEVTDTEKRAIASAMKLEFHGSGHWYTCVNGHPFTIGECGMAMEVATCPECGQGVGGSNHQALAGVRHDLSMDRLAHI